MNDLALAAFAAETGGHVVDEPKELRFARFRRTFDGESFRASLEARNLRFVGRSEPGYPRLLRELHDPPPGLFLRGSADVELLSEPAVAIVGARMCSSYGGQVARMLGRELAAAGLVIVSGLARGVDGEAPSSRDGSASTASSSPSTPRASSRRHGGSRPGTGSSQASRAPRSWSRPAKPRAR